ncbi:hypothetical protein Tco_1027405 [Tanacetum coccineum]
MNNKKHILNLDQFIDILQICPKVGNKKFEEPPLKKEILAFLASLGHSGEIRKITDVNKGNAMYYPHFTKLIVNFVMAKDPSIPRRNKVNWHYARDDPIFTTINVISRNEDTQLYGTILPAELTNEDIRNSESYKEYYAIASGMIPPKTKASKKKAPIVPKEKKGKKTGKGKQKAKELETISKAILTEAEQLKIITKRTRKETHSSHASGSGADEGTGVSPGVLDAPDYDSDDDISLESSEDDQDDDKNAEKEKDQDDDGDDFIHPKLTTHDDETTHEEETDEDDTFNPIVHTPSRVSSSDDEDSDNEVEGVDVEGEKSDEDATDEEDKGNETDKDTNANLEGRDDVMTDVILPQVQATQEIEDTHVTLTPVNPDGQQQSSSVSSGFVSNMLNPNQDTGVDAIFGQHAEATSLIDIPVTAIAEPSFFAPTNRPPTPNPLFIQLQQPPILTPATTPSSSLQNLPDFALKAKTTPAVAANLSELELKKILIDKMEANNSINRSDIQRQLYKALVDAYKADKILLDTYGDTITIKRPRVGADDDQEPSAGTDRGSKRRRSGKEPESTSTPREKTTTTAGKTTTGSKTHKQSASQSAPVEETIQSTDVFDTPAHQEFETGVHDKQAE